MCLDSCLFSEDKKTSISQTHELVCLTTSAHVRKSVATKMVLGVAKSSSEKEICCHGNMSVQ